MKFKIETHLIGFSLGSHVCGFFGKMIRKRLGQGNEITKIIGLDPAGTIFDFHEHSRELALNKCDAASVEIFHTNVETLGYTDEHGDEIYTSMEAPYQPGCKPPPNNFIERWLEATCHHIYAYQVMLILLNKDIPCVFQNLDARNRHSSPAKPFCLKSGPICIDSKPAFYIGNLTSPIKDGYNLDLESKCTIMCKKEHYCIHQENSEIMNKLINASSAG